MRWWPRTIRGQILAGLLLLETLSLGLFAAFLILQQTQEIKGRVALQLQPQVTSMVMEASDAVAMGHPAHAGLAVKMLGQDPSVAFVKVTDTAGHVLLTSDGNPGGTKMDPVELAQMAQSSADVARVFPLGDGRWESVRPIYVGRDLYGFAWVEANRSWSQAQLRAVLTSIVFFALLWAAASALLVGLLSYSITRPLETLRRGTGALIQEPIGDGVFPLPVTTQNEIGDLILAFNRMAATLVRQREGLDDTLALLDSMLANAPVGLIFFDRRGRMVRVNQVFANLSGVPAERQIGRTLPEVLPHSAAEEMGETVKRVLDSLQPEHNLEVSGAGGRLNRAWTWLVSAYPVWTAQHNQVRWVGMIVLDATERKRTEDALRKTEKLAATGRLAASVAHEINNPLEAITNLLFLLRNFCQLDVLALNYVEMAEHEVRRVAEITQQTLRFFRQSTLPARANMAELLDAVIGLYQGRIRNLNLHVERGYHTSLELFCFSGELRQVFANLVGNALDASRPGGRLVVRARRSHHWKRPEEEGIRFAVADTGSGMTPEVRKQIFEAFFTTKEATGNGLGLWVSQEIVAKHGGLIHVRSRAEGGATGTVFQLFFPDNPPVSQGEEQQEQTAG
jgi:PAS domain S-box-containing protein